MWSEADTTSPDPGAAPLPSTAEMAERQAALVDLGPLRLDQIETLSPGLHARQMETAEQALQPNRSNRSCLGFAIRLVDEFDQAVQSLVACRRGFAHCCHIRVEMTALEAQQLGDAIGRKPNTRHRYMPAEEGALNLEPPRVLRRLQPLRGWSHEEVSEVFP
jgi:hypothetical protein